MSSISVPQTEIPALRHQLDRNDWGVFFMEPLYYQSKSECVFVFSQRTEKIGASGSTGLSNILRKKRFIIHLKVLTSLNFQPETLFKLNYYMPR